MGTRPMYTPLVGQAPTSDHVEQSQALGGIASDNDAQRSRFDLGTDTMKKPTLPWLAGDSDAEEFNLRPSM